MKKVYSTSCYDVYTVSPDSKGFYFPYVLCVPKEIVDGANLYVETNNEENPKDLFNSAKYSIDNIINMMNLGTNKSPIMMPILPSNGIDAKPYFQQLSKEFHCTVQTPVWASAV